MIQEIKQAPESVRFGWDALERTWEKHLRKPYCVLHWRQKHDERGRVDIEKQNGDVCTRCSCTVRKVVAHGQINVPIPITFFFQENAPTSVADEETINNFWYTNRTDVKV